MNALLFYLFLHRDSTNFAAFPRVWVEARFASLGAPGKQFAVRSDKGDKVWDSVGSGPVGPGNDERTTAVSRRGNHRGDPPFSDVFGPMRAGCGETHDKMLVYQAHGAAGPSARSRLL